MDRQQRSPQATGNRHSFVVRIWREAGSPIWRGSVQQVSSGQTHSFDGMDKLLAFLERQIASLTEKGENGLN